MPDNEEDGDDDDDDDVDDDGDDDDGDEEEDNEDENHLNVKMCVIFSWLHIVGALLVLPIHRHRFRHRYLLSL